jgi:hypothetical protein
MTLRIGVGVDSNPDTGAGIIIRTATESCCTPPWVLGPAHPATHAFVWWGHSDEVFYRLDGMPPHAVPSAWHGPDNSHRADECCWEFSASDEVATNAWTRALQLAGVPYNDLELLAQPFAGKAAQIKDDLKQHGILPGDVWDHLFAVIDDHVFHLRTSMICTSIACEVIKAIGDVGVSFVDNLEDRFPERFAQHLSGAEHQGWLARITP